MKGSANAGQSRQSANSATTSATESVSAAGSEPSRASHHAGRDDERGDGCGVGRQHHEVGEAAPRDAAAEARFHVEAERVADAGHRERVADQQQHERQRMLHRRGEREREPGRQQVADASGRRIAVEVLRVSACRPIVRGFRGAREYIGVAAGVPLMRG